MKRYVLTTIVLILFAFAGCTTHRKISKSSADLKIVKDIDSQSKVELKSTDVKTGKSAVKESSIVEEITVKKPTAIELTANFKIDSSATLRGDTALKLVDITDKNVSVTIYQNSKTNVLTAKIKSKTSVEDVPFSEISIKKTTSTKEATVDTTKTLTKDSTITTSLKDKSKIESSQKVVEKNINKVNYSFLVIFGLVVVLILFFILKRKP